MAVVASDRFAYLTESDSTIRSPSRTPACTREQETFNETPMSTLTQQLDQLNQEKRANRPPAITAVLDRATDALRATGQHESAIGVGDVAPLFARPSLDGTTVRLKSLLARGPVVLSFFRGRW